MTLAFWLPPEMTVAHSLPYAVLTRAWRAAMAVMEARFIPADKTLAMARRGAILSCLCSNKTYLVLPCRRVLSVQNVRLALLILGPSF